MNKREHVRRVKSEQKELEHEREEKVRERRKRLPCVIPLTRCGQEIVASFASTHSGNPSSEDKY